MKLDAFLNHFFNFFSAVRFFLLLALVSFEIFVAVFFERIDAPCDEIDSQIKSFFKLFFKLLPKSQFTSTTVSRTHPFRTQPIGTGPYRLDSYNDDNSVTFLSHPEPSFGWRVFCDALGP